jgi:hypothetical protein
VFPLFAGWVLALALVLWRKVGAEGGAAPAMPAEQPMATTG